ncbi:hypothetical protein TWF481_006468 [Arthrobotrys musiformis]|uniref:Enoyl reductase (ER) domain-containing protein n=1 Tax=Arthrobotrys musiformis TaxID=47236 RepID=A0AAV9WEC1_9PEZI
MSYTTKQWLLKESPRDFLELDKTFEMVTKGVSVQDLKDGELLVKTTHLSNDPAQRVWISKYFEEERSYRKPIMPGELMEAICVGEVIESKDPKFQKGDLIQADLGWTQYSIIPSSKALFKVTVPPADWLSLGHTALTAYFGLLRVGAATSNDKTIVISGAAGATGIIACQIAKNVLGVEKVIGIAGTDEKCAILKEYGCDIALNYKSSSFKEDFVKATPDWIDVYFDNVGGEILDTALRRMKDFGRVIACGAISTYDVTGQSDNGLNKISPQAWTQIILSKVRVEGFIIFQFEDQWLKGIEDIQNWVIEGKIKPLKHVWEATIEGTPEGMIKLSKGENIGKLITQLIY